MRLSQAQIAGQRLPSLDGWRALSILLVLGDHSVSALGFPQEWSRVTLLFFNGNFGVRIFFIISGFLITWLMLKEFGASRHVNLKHFYLRRALRILPVYAAFLLIMAWLQTITNFSQSPGAWMANITFTTGMGLWGGGYSHVTAHLWSLAVEEQFYLLWPMIFVTAGLGCASGKFTRGFMILCVPIFLAPLARSVSYAEIEPLALRWLFVKSGFLCNADSLAIGCAAALGLHHCPDRFGRILVTRPYIAMVVCGICVVVPAVLAWHLCLGVFTVPLGPTMQGLGIAGFILQSVFLATSRPYTILNRRIVVWLGVLSYSIYIWQQPLFNAQAFGWPRVWWLSFPGWLLTSLLVACVSYYCLECPFMRARARLR